MEKYYINVPISEINAQDNILQRFNHIVNIDDYKILPNNNCANVYNIHYKHILKLSLNILPITYSPDPCISAASCAGSAEKYMYQTEIEPNVVQFKSKLKILYITPNSHIYSNITNYNARNLNNSIIANLLASCEFKNQDDFNFVKNKCILSIDNFILIGINEKVCEDFEINELNECGITYMTYQTIKKKGIEGLKSILENNPIHVIFDLSVMDKMSCPCVTKYNNGQKSYTNIDGFNTTQMTDIFRSLSSLNIVGLDVTMFNFQQNQPPLLQKITSETAKLPLKYMLKVREKKINIMTADSKFLIWRPREQCDSRDVCWSILYIGCSELKNKLIEKIEKDSELIEREFDDYNDVCKITTYNFINEYTNEVDYTYISTTTINEQQQKVLTSQTCILDRVLSPDQKIDMAFQLIS
jgi:arginase family enzyme